MFGIPSHKDKESPHKEKKRDGLEDIRQMLKEIDANRRIVELDLEKRAIVLENEMEKIKKLLQDIKDLEDVKGLAENSKEIKEKIRNLEDMKYVENLEVIDMEERLGEMESIVEVTKKKLSILEEAIDTLTKKGLPSANKELEEKVGKMWDELKSAHQQIEYLRSKMASEEDIKEVKNLAEKGREMINQINKDMEELTSSIKEKFEAYDMKLEGYEQKINEKLKMLDSLNQEIEKTKSQAENAKELATKTYEVMEKTRKGMLLKYDTLEKKYKDIDKKIEKKMEYVLKRYDKALELIEFQISSLKKQSSELKAMQLEVGEEKIREVESKILKAGRELESKYKKIEEMKKSIEELVSNKASIDVSEIKKILDSPKVKRIQHYISRLEELEENLSKKVEDQEIEIEGLKKSISSLRQKLKESNKASIDIVNSKVKEIDEQLEHFKRSQQSRVERKINELMQEKVEEVVSEVIEKIKNDSQLKKHEREEMKKIKQEVDAYLLTLSKNVYKSIESKMQSIEKEVKHLSSEIKQEYDVDELVQIITDSVWSEVASLISSHEITENIKIKLAEEFTKQLREEVDKVKGELVSFVREQKSEVLDVEDVKRKLFDLVKEERERREKEMKELRQYIDNVLNSRVVEAKDRGKLREDEGIKAKEKQGKDNKERENELLRKEQELINKIKQLEEEIKEIKEEERNHFRELSHTGMPFIIE